jgi:glycosyltransferase involved in cell wall biosynthesis
MRIEDITVVVPTRNEQKNIRAFLRSLPDAVSLIVVDASDDETPAMILALRPLHTSVLRRKSSITEARQIGSEVTKTGWVLFTDADVIFPNDYFDRLQTYAAYDAVYGPKLSRKGYIWYYRWFAFGQRLSHVFGVPAATGSNMLVRRGVIADAGGFDLQLVCNEDSELVWRIKRAGYRVAFAADLKVYARDHRRLKRGLWRKTTHSIVRCLLLYLDLMPARWRGKDWGYWSHLKESKDG